MIKTRIKMKEVLTLEIGCWWKKEGVEGPSESKHKKSYQKKKKKINFLFDSQNKKLRWS